MRPNRRPALPLLAAAALILCLTLPASAAAAAPGRAPAAGLLRVPFVAESDAAGGGFRARTPRAVISVTPSGEIHYLLPRRSEAGGAAGAVTLREALVGAQVEAVAGRDRSVTRVNVLHGDDPSRWRRNLPAFDGLSLGEVYPGIGMTLQVRGHGVEKIFAVAPGADPEAIRLRIGGGRGLAVTAEGELAVETELGPVRFSAPIAYQEGRPGSGARERVEVAYRVAGDEYGFALGAYDRSRPLVVDPILAGTFYGGGDEDEAFAIDRNDAGIYVAGYAYWDLPGVGGGAADPDGNFGLPRFQEGWVVRLDPGLTTILDATYLGGSGDEKVYDLMLDPSGAVYVTGTTGSADFPGISGSAADQSFSGDSEAFVARLDANLSNIEQATFLGGVASDDGMAVFRDVFGKIYAAGATRSDDFPGVDSGSADSLFQGYGEAFVARLDADLETLEAATFLGGLGPEGALDVMRSALGSVYVVGFTRSLNFPGTGLSSADNLFDGSSEAFVSRLNADLTSVVSTFIGGGSSQNTGFLDVARAIDEDSAGNLYVGGQTFSPNSFPGIGPLSADDVYWDGEGFVVKLDQTLSVVLAGTFLGGNTWDGIRDLKVDAAQRVWVTGHSAGSFPAPGGGAMACGSGVPNYGAVVAVLNAALSTVLAAECPRWGKGHSLVLTPTGVYTAGVTDDGSFGGPSAITPASADDVQSNDEGFVLHLDLGLPAAPVLKLAALDALISQILAPSRFSGSLRRALAQAEAEGYSDRDTPAIRQLVKFEKLVQRGLKQGLLTQDQATQLMADAEDVIEDFMDQATLAPLAHDRRREGDAAPLPQDWMAVRPPYRWRPPGMNLPGDFQSETSPADTLPGAAGP